jgi:hypothetical protein
MNGERIQKSFQRKDLYIFAPRLYKTPDQKLRVFLLGFWEVMVLILCNFSGTLRPSGPAMLPFFNDQEVGDLSEVQSFLLPQLPQFVPLALQPRSRYVFKNLWKKMCFLCSGSPGSFTSLAIS